MDILEPNERFDFSLLGLGQPSSIQGGAYFTKLQYNEKPFYIETPKSLTRQGFVKNGKKMVVDLMFDNTNEEFIHWIENLETKCQELIHEKGDSWFQNKLEMNDIESAFNSPMKIYKSGKFYLVRVNVKMNYSTNNPYIKIYNENEVPLSIDDVNTETNVISILEIQGIKFTTRSFQIEMEVKQMMVLNTYEIFESCVIKHKVKMNDNRDKENSLANEETNDVVNIENNEKTEVDKLLMLEDNVDEDKLYESVGEPYKEEVDKTIEREETIEMMAEKEEREKTIEKEETIEKKETNPLDDFELTEVDLDNIENLETIQLKKPNQVYYEIYKEARKRAKEAKKNAMIAFLEAKNIKKTYMLEDLDDSDESSAENFSDDEVENEDNDNEDGDEEYLE